MYVGRFAPSPTGPLHFGSLCAALVSWLDAKANNGHWYLRIDDLDVPRVVCGAAQAIQTTLQRHGLQWQGPVQYQQPRYAHYRAALHTLSTAGQTYRCNCPRARTQGRAYDGYCKQHPPASSEQTAIRLHIHNHRVRYTDKWQGRQSGNLATDCGDFIVWRKDGLCSYQLAVVVDDNALGITHVIRGIDLMDSTPRQLLLYRQLGLSPPAYGHFPVLVDAKGRKLSKQNHAAAVNDNTAAENLRTALTLLQQPAPPPNLRTAAAIVAFAGRHWQPETMPAANSIKP